MFHPLKKENPSVEPDLNETVNNASNETVFSESVDVNPSEWVSAYDQSIPSSSDKFVSKNPSINSIPNASIHTEKILFLRNLAMSNQFQNPKSLLKTLKLLLLK